MEMGRVDLGRVVLVPISPELVLSGAVLVVGHFLSRADCQASSGILSNCLVQFHANWTINKKVIED